MNRKEFYTFAKSDTTFSTFDAHKQRLGEEALQYAFDWHIQNPKVGTERDNIKQSRKACKAYIKKNFHPVQTNYGYSSSLIAGWIFYLVLNAVINWVIRRLLDDWLFKK